MNQQIFLCENNIEGIFTGIYDIWDSRLPKEGIKLSCDEEGNYELFSEYIHVKTDILKADKVAKTIQQRFGEINYTSIYQAACSNEKDKARLTSLIEGGAFFWWVRTRIAATTRWALEYKLVNCIIIFMS